MLANIMHHEKLLILSWIK